MYLDIGCAIVFSVFGLVGFLKGLLSQVISIVAMVAGLMAALFGTEPVAGWLTGVLTRRASSLDPGFVRVGTFIILLFLVYILAASLFEAAKKKLIHSFSLRLSDRMLGMLVGMAKGAAVVLLIVIIADGAQGFVRTITSPQGFERYQQWLDRSEVFGGGRYALGLSRNRSPAVSNMMYQIEQWLPGSVQPAKQQTPPHPALQGTNQPPAQPVPPPSAQPAQPEQQAPQPAPKEGQ